jgi:hypothetical protein
MMTKHLQRLAPGALVLLLAGCSTASSAPKTPQAPVPAEAETIRELMRVTGAAEIGLQFLDGLMGPLKSTAPEVPEALWEEMRSRIATEEIVDLVVPIYQEHLSQADAEALVAFWSSPVGQRFVEKQPLILQESMAVGRKWGEDLARDILEELQEKGYEINASTDGNGALRHPDGERLGR